jgi:hypothetical protein
MREVVKINFHFRMKKILPKILIGVIMVSFFLVPVSVNIQQTPSNPVAIVIENNQAEAQFLGAYGALYDYWSSGAGFGCGSLPNTWHKCIVQWIYYLVFMPLAFFARLAAQILDFFIYYSTNSDSYTSDFVEKGWAVVRDVSNLFFVIALLSVAIKTILSMHDAHTKKMVGTIIIVALLINFSLFTTKVVIDASNILAKIFYNNIDSVGENGLPLSSGGGQKSITLGLVKEFNPHTIFTESHVEGGISGNIGLFAVLLFLSIGIMGYMIYMFISVTMLFVARVIGLWLSMIFSPIAFASHILPFDIGGLGYRKWSEDLFKNAFLAPIFIFFLYIIILFGDFLTIVTYGNSAGGIFSVNDFQSYMKIIIPFMIIFGLLMKAKALAVEYSGEMGQNMSKIGAAIGGLALGGAALGTAALGRSTIGAFAKGASTGDTYARRLAAERTSGIRDTNLTAFQRLQGRLSQGTGIDALQQRYGQRLNRQGAEIRGATHARHDLDTAANAVAPGKKWDDLNGTERRAAKQNIERTRLMRERGFGNRTWAQLTDMERLGINTDVEDRLNTGTTYTDTHTIPQARRKVGLRENLEQSTIGGSF